MSEQISNQAGVAQPPPPPTYDPRAFTPSGLSIAAFVLGILSFVTCGPCFGIPAIVIGLIELKNIRNLSSSAEGRPFALTGAILGGISSVLAVLIIVFYIIMMAIVIFAGAMGESF